MRGRFVQPEVSSAMDESVTTEAIGRWHPACVRGFSLLCAQRLHVCKEPTTSFSRLVLWPQQNDGFISRGEREARKRGAEFLHAEKRVDVFVRASKCPLGRRRTR